MIKTFYPVAEGYFLGKRAKRQKCPPKLSQADRERIVELVMRDGVPQVDVAREYRVHPSTVNKIIIKAKGATARVVAVEQSEAEHFIGVSVDGFQRIIQMQEETRALLKEFLDYLSCDDATLDRIRRKYEELGQPCPPDPLKAIISLMRESRGQLKLHAEMQEKVWNMQQIAVFQEEMLRILGEIDKDARDEFIRRLNDRRAVRFSGGQNP